MTTHRLAELVNAISRVSRRANSCFYVWAITPMVFKGPVEYNCLISKAEHDKERNKDRRDTISRTGLFYLSISIFLCLLVCMSTCGHSQPPICVRSPVLVPGVSWSPPCPHIFLYKNDKPRRRLFSTFLAVSTCWPSPDLREKFIRSRISLEYRWFPNRSNHLYFGRLPKAPPNEISFGGTTNTPWPNDSKRSTDHKI